MNRKDFTRAISAFADTPADIDWDGNQLLVQVREDVIEASLSSREGDLYVCENDGKPIRAYDWIVRRVARIDQLAQRILDYVPEEKCFVVPDGYLLDDLDKDPSETDHPESDVVKTLNDKLSSQPAGVSSILYLTSDAGEGKTTTINYLARLKAAEYQKKQSSWLLVPIALGGRPFMRLDDVVVAEMSNQYRFMLYYQAFVELVRLNVIVPALDGFEEVFEERSSGEGASSLGRVISQLDGDGRLLVAARKAYFEIKSLAAQAKLYDSFGSMGSADFSRLSLARWTKEKFLGYAQKSNLINGEEIYGRVLERLSPSHPMLTRAVLAGRLIEVAAKGEVSDLLSKLGQHPEDYFFHFVNTIVEREAFTKWTYRPGNIGAAEPLLAVDEHHELLTSISREMWINGTEELSEEIISLLAEMYSDEKRKSPVVARQIQERVHQHALLISTGHQRKGITFDHEDFGFFYLGLALAKEIAQDAPDSEAFLQIAILPIRSIEAAVERLRREGQNLWDIGEKVRAIGETHLKSSYVNANASNLYLALHDGLQEPMTSTATNLLFPPDALREKRFSKMMFQNCYFSPTATSNSTLREITFNSCEFERIELGACQIENCKFSDCKVMSIVDLASGNQDQEFDPQYIKKMMTQMGFDFDVDMPERSTNELDEPHDKIKLIAVRALRAFMRSTQINENVLKKKMGSDANLFINEVLPSLVKDGIIETIPFRGGGRHQRRYKLAVSMKKIEKSMQQSKTLPELIDELKK